MSGDYERDPGLPRGVMSERHGPRFTARLLFGLVLVSLGALWTLENLGVPEASEVLRWWPSLLVAYGFVRLTGLDGRRRVVSGSLFMLAGGWMLARELGIVQVSLFRLWPVFMIAIGSTLVWRSMRGSSLARDDSDRSTYPRPFAFMGGVTRNVDSQDLVGLEATAVMGGVEADLRGARARGREVVVEVFAWWGGIDLIVPENWRVVSEVMPIMGGVDDQSKVVGADAVTTIVVRGLVVMGGVEVRNTPRARDREVRGVRIGVVSDYGRGRRKEVRIDPSGVTITREDAPPAAAPPPPSSSSAGPPPTSPPPTSPPPTSPPPAS